MRALIVVPSIAPGTGGTATAVFESLAPLARAGIETITIATDLSRAASARSGERLGAAEITAPDPRASIRLCAVRRPYRFAFSPQLHAALRGQAPVDLVHIHSLFLFPQFAAWRYCRRTATPYLVSIHGALDRYLRERGRMRKRLTSLAWQDDMLRNASLIHVTSDAEADAVSEVIPHDRLVTVPNGIDTAHFDQVSSGGEFRRRFLNGHDGPLVLYLGRLSFKKGLGLLIDGFAAAHRELPGARLAVVGPDDEGLLPSLRDRARELRIAEAVTFTGPLYGPNRLDALGAADAWVLPSHTENFGIAVIEAMAAGVPVIVSTGVNIAPDIEATDAGVVIDREVPALRDALVRLLRNDELRTALAERGRALARGYDWSTVGPQLAAAYRAAAGRPHRAT